MARVPRWVIALVLVLLLSGMEFLSVQRRSMDYSMSPDRVGDTIAVVLICLILLAGAIQRLSWRHGLVILVILAVGWGLQQFLEWSEILVVRGYHPHLWLVYPMVLMLALGIGEMLTTGRRSWRVLLWVFVAALAATAVQSTIQAYVNWMNVRFIIPTGPSSRRYFYLSPMTYWPIFCLVAWIFLSLGLSAAGRSGRNVRIAVVAFIAVGLFHAVFFYSVAFRLAESSLVGEGPFSRQIGVELLEIRGNDSDFESLLHGLCQDDWEPWDHLDGSDWRRTAIGALDRHDSARAAEAILQLLRRKRNWVLATCSTDIIVNRRLYEAVPVLFRYALEPPVSTTPGDCNKVLERLGIPEAGLYILGCEGLRRRRGQITAEDLHFDIAPEVRDRLKALLKKDVGSAYLRWSDAVDEAIARRPSILPESVQQEMDRERICNTAYLTAFDRWYSARAEVVRHRMIAMGMREAYQDMENYVRQVAEGSRERWDVPDSLSRVQMKFNACFETATRQMKPPPPNFDAPSIEAFEDEIDAYVDRVNAVITKYWCPTTKPARNK